MKQVDLKTRVKNLTTMLIIASISAVVALPSMVTALTNNNWFIAVPCMVIVVCSFYGLPLAWMYLRTLKEYSSIVDTITTGNVKSLKELATLFNKREKTMRKTVTKIVSKGYLAGFKWSEDITSLVASREKRATKCVNCGAPIVPEEKHCSYCGSHV